MIDLSPKRSIRNSAAETFYYVDYVRLGSKQVKTLGGANGGPFDRHTLMTSSFVNHSRPNEAQGGYPPPLHTCSLSQAVGVPIYRRVRCGVDLVSLRPSHGWA